MISYLVSVSPSVFAQRAKARRDQTQNRSTPHAAPEQKPTEPAYTTQPLDVSVSSLPAGFRGHDAAEIYKRLAERTKVSTKSEFETTEAYRQRVQLEASKPLTGSLTQRSTFAFVIGKLDAKYDADQQVMYIKAKLSRVKEGAALDEDKRSLLWDIVNRDNSSYTGSNAYGAQVQVERKVADFYEVAFANHQRFPIVSYLNDIAQEVADNRKKRYESLGIKEPEQNYDFMKDTAFAAEIKMDAQAAMKSKPNLRLLLVCRLLTPPIIEGSTYSKPTVDNPRENLFLSYSLNTEALEVWFFDVVTGQIHAKQKGS